MDNMTLTLEQMNDRLPFSPSQVSYKPVAISSNVNPIHSVTQDYNLWSKHLFYQIYQTIFDA